MIGVQKSEDILDRWLSNVEHRARQILLDAGHDPSRPGLLPETFDHGCLLYDSHLLLRHLGIFRSEIIRNMRDAIWRVVQISEIADKHDFFVDHGEAIKRGLAFINGPKNKRHDALAREIVGAFEILGPKASASQVLAFLEKTGKVEVEDERIYGKSYKGREKPPTFKAFRNRISKLRPRSY